MLKRIPADHHPIVAVESHPKLGIGSIAICSRQRKQSCQGSEFLHRVNSEDTGDLLGKLSRYQGLRRRVCICRSRSDHFLQSFQRHGSTKIHLYPPIPNEKPILTIPSPALVGQYSVHAGKIQCSAASSILAAPKTGMCHCMCL